jgi:hypothetical protein
MPVCLSRAQTSTWLASPILLYDALDAHADTLLENLSCVRNGVQEENNSQSGDFVYCILSSRHCAPRESCVLIKYL